MPVSLSHFFPESVKHLLKYSRNGNKHRRPDFFEILDERFCVFRVGDCRALRKRCEISGSPFKRVRERKERKQNIFWINMDIINRGADVLKNIIMRQLNT